MREKDKASLAQRRPLTEREERCPGRRCRGQMKAPVCRILTRISFQNPPEGRRASLSLTHSATVCSPVSRPRSRARRMARVRLLTPSFERIWLTCSLTVPGATTNTVAISWLEAPPANNCSTSSSRWLNGSSNGCVRTSGLVFLAQAFEMPGQAWGKR